MDFGRLIHAFKLTFLLVLWSGSKAQAYVLRPGNIVAHRLYMLIVIFAPISSPTIGSFDILACCHPNY